MTIGLSNASSRARNRSQTTNINQGGGSKKAGFPYLIGRSSASSIAIKSTEPIHGNCCTLSNLSKDLVFKTSISRNIGYNGNPTYWKFP